LALYLGCLAAVDQGGQSGSLLIVDRPPAFRIQVQKEKVQPDYARRTISTAAAQELLPLALSLY
jgi:hypothetical protein